MIEYKEMQRTNRDCWTNMLLSDSWGTQLTHHCASGDFPKSFSLLGLPIGALSSSLPGEQQLAGALRLHLGKAKINRKLRHAVLHRFATSLYDNKTDTQMHSHSCTSSCVHVLDTTLLHNSQLIVNLDSCQVIQVGLCFVNFDRLTEGEKHAPRLNEPPRRLRFN